MPTALLSVYDKAGIVELAEGLHQLGWRIVSSGGTAKAIAAAGTPVTDLADLTGVPAILDHRVVTLHPKIHGGLLADPTKPEHQADMAEYGIEPIDLVVCNLYPFATDPSIELIDIGGPAMVRAAAKNHQFVAVVVDPSDYGVVLDELRADGAISAATKRRLARDAFARIAAYDAQIAEWFNEGPLARDDAPLPAQGSAAALRREPSSVGSPLPRRRTAELVGRRRAARRQGAQLPQPVRHRSCVAARPALRRPGVRDRQTRQPVRRRRRQTTSPTPTSRPMPAIRSARSAASLPSTARCRQRWPMPWPRCSPR